ncbi:MAG: 50S ribosomal protein L11 methyltransferase, partial [Actinobacteria bacterium]|nr:50S ribosomal protein L11 methyltransferase [Actinomycetota bacterium]
MSSQAANEIEWKGRTGPFTLLVTPGVFAPTHTSRTLADALEIEPGDTVIDVGCGSGVLSFVAARLGAERVVGCDLSLAAVEAARENARRLGLEGRTEFRVGNLFEPVRDVRAQVVIGDVSGIPDEIAEVAGWFPDGPAGGPTGAELPA